MGKRKIIPLGAIAAGLVFFLFGASLISKDKKEPPLASGPAAAWEKPASGEKAPRAELRALYLDLEGFLKAGKLHQKGWLDSEEYAAWSKRLSWMGGGGFTPDQNPDVPEPERGVARALRSLCVGLGHGELSENDHRIVLDAIRTGPSDSLGADLAQFWAKYFTATPPKFNEKTTLAVQQEIRAFIAELETLRFDTSFHERGFSGSHRGATRWKDSLEAWRERVEHNPALPVLVSLAPVQLDALALEWGMYSGLMTDNAQVFLRNLNDALYWKPEP